MIFNLYFIRSYAQKYKNFSYEKALVFFNEKNYKNSLLIFLELEKQFPNELEINLKIGMCYLQIPYKKTKSIPYLEKAVKIINLKYSKEPNLKITDEMINSYLLLSKSYQLDYQFSGAIFTLKDIKSMIEKNQKFYKIDLEISICKNAIELLKNPLDLEVENFSKLNTKFSENNLIFSKNENNIFYNSNENGDKRIIKNKKYFNEIVKNQETNFLEKISNESKITGISSNGNELLICKNNDIYISFFKKGKWTKEKKLKINSKYNEIHASFSPDGKYLFFVSDRKGGFGGFDIYFSVRKRKNKWSKPKNLGKIINTSFDENSPFFYEKTNTLFFSSKGHKTMGNYDIFYSDWIDKNWSDVINLGFPVNSPEDELNFFLNSKNLKGYFDSQRRGGKGDFDIFTANFMDGNCREKTHFLEETKNSKTVVAEGYFLKKDIKNGEIMQITVTDNNFDIVGLFTPNKENGKYILNLKVNKNYNLNYIYANNFSYNLDLKVPYDSSFENLRRPMKLKNLIINKENKVLSEIETKNFLSNFVEKKVIMLDKNLYIDFSENLILNENSIGTKVILKNIAFKRSKDKLLISSYPELKKLIKMLKKYPKAKIEISGHTGKLVNSLELSQMRADEVVNYLVKFGIKKNRLIAKGYGNKFQIASENNEKGRKKNRRVEFKIIEF